MNFPRFKPPGRLDEIYHCPGCGLPFYYTSLDALGLCADCREDKLTDEMEEDGKDRKLTGEL